MKPIEALVAERTLAKKQRNFARADQIRNELADKGSHHRRLERWRALEAEVGRPKRNAAFAGFA